MPSRKEMRKGSTEVLILSMLAEQPMYGYLIAQELKERSEGYFEMQEGLLYPALHRMEKDEMLTSEWRTVTGARRRKYYLITERGRKVLDNSVAEWATFTATLMRLIGGQSDGEPQAIPG